MTLEIRKVEAYQWQCPYCDWITTNSQVELTKWTADYHMRDACPEVGRRWVP